MKITKSLVAIVGTAALAIAPAEAALITYNFVPSAAPAPGGGVFTAQASFDDSLVGAGFQFGLPTKFSASLSGNSIFTDRAWEIDEVSASVFSISSSEVLTYAFLLGFDNDQIGIGSLLTSVPGSFVTPVFVPGSWQQIAFTPSGDPVPEGGPGALAAAAVVGMGIVARRQRRKRVGA